MATYRGTDGVVKIGSTAVGEMQGFSITASAATIGDNAAGDDWDTHLVGRKSWSGSLTLNSDSTDTGQALLACGSTAAGTFYPEGNASGLIKLNGNFTVTSIEWTANHDNQIVGSSIQFLGNGELTETNASV